MHPPLAQPYHSSSANLSETRQSPAACSIRTLKEMLMPEYQESINEVRDAILQDDFQGLLCAS